MSQTFSKIPAVPVRPESTWKTVLECSVMEVFEMMANVHLEPISCPDGQPQDDYTAMVGIAGALCGMASIRCTRETAARLAAAMLGEEPFANPWAPTDALGELCNMVAGNFKAKIDNLADHCMLSVPTVISGDDYLLQTMQPARSFVTTFAYDGARIWVSLIVHE